MSIPLLGAGLGVDGPSGPTNGLLFDTGANYLIWSGSSDYIIWQ